MSTCLSVHLKSKPKSLSKSSHISQNFSQSAYQPLCQHAPPLSTSQNLHLSAIMPTSHHSIQEPGPPFSASQPHTYQPSCLSSIRIPRLKNCYLSFSVLFATFKPFGLLNNVRSVQPMIDSTIALSSNSSNYGPCDLVLIKQEWSSLEWNLYDNWDDVEISNW